jgi:hypothetical protein
MTHNTVAMMEDHPLGCFKKLITASGIALSEMSIYSYRKMKCADDQIIHQCMMKIPHGSLDELLKHSGQAELFVRQFIQPQEETNHSILPRYFAINPEDVRSAKLLGESVGDGYRGLALTAKGVAIRASNAKLADARALVLQNRHEVHRPQQGCGQQICVHLSGVPLGHLSQKPHRSHVHCCEDGPNSTAQLQRWRHDYVGPCVWRAASMQYFHGKDGFQTF